jgi:hypothetical protein
MKKYNIRKMMRNALLPCLFLLSCTACTLEEVITGDGEGNSPRSGSETRVNFSITVPSPSPSPSSVQTRSTGNAPDESAVNVAHLLLFEEINGVRTYRYRIHAENITDVSNTQKTFHANIPTGKYDIVIVANAQEILNGSGISFGDTKEQVLGALVETNSGVWNNAAVPMWGQQDSQLIDDGTDFTGRNAFRMIRMVAKIEVEVTPDAAGMNNENFALTDVRLYNYSSRGALVPDPGTWPADNRAVQPTCPAVPGGYVTVQYPANAPLIFNTKTFYAYEAPAGGKGQAMSGNTCIVIGGSYRGRAATYYRVDFTDRNDPDVFLPLLRNRHYLVRIIDVSGDGYPTPEMAFDATRSGMVTGIVEWNDGGVGDVTMEGQNTLEVSANTFVFPGEAQTASTEANRLTIRTSVAGGWEIEKITDESGAPGTAPWLTVSQSSFASPDTPEDVYLFATENTTGSGRTAYLYIRAGELSYRVTVSQKERFDIWITDSNGQEINELVFPLSGAAQSFTVSWTPASLNVTVDSTTIGMNSAGSPERFFGVYPESRFSLSNGSGTYDAQAYKYTGTDKMIHRASKFDFTLSDGTTSVTRTIFLRQYDASLKAVNVPSYFPVDGGVKKIGIRANIAWEVVDVIDPGKIIVNRSELIGKTGEMNITSAGEAFSFRIANYQNYPSFSSSTATFVFRDVHGALYNVEVTGRSV